VQLKRKKKDGQLLLCLTARAGRAVPTSPCLGRTAQTEADQEEDFLTFGQKVLKNRPLLLLFFLFVDCAPM